MTLTIILACVVALIGVGAFVLGRMIERADHEYREEHWHSHN